MERPSDCYPASEEVDAWCAHILRRAQDLRFKVDTSIAPVYDFRLGVRHTGGVYLHCVTEGLGEFYCFWQPCPSGGGPVLVHVPGYGAEMSAHPELVADGYNVLHVNPLGYATPHGPDEAKKEGDSWPVLPETVRSRGKKGYVDWLTQAAAMALWARSQDGVDAARYAFFGTSQGGGTALLLASILRDEGVRAVAADVPFLVNFPLAAEAEFPGAYGLVLDPLRKISERHPEEAAAAWKAIGFVDTISHAHRLSMPTLLTAGKLDETCTAANIRSLFEMLPGTRSYTELAGQGHAYTTAFLHLARAWFRLYV